MILKAESPIDGKIYFFVDKCLPFGHSISCAIFQEISDGITHIVQCKLSKRLINYLDDYFFVATLRSQCDRQISVFLSVCKQVGMPVSMEKTFWSDEIMTSLLFLINGRKHLVMVPLDKLAKANEIFDKMLTKGKRKTTVLRLQQICGFLNFLCRCVVLGRAFTRRLYNLIPAKMKPHHHIKINQEMRMDLAMWKEFLSHAIVFCRNFSVFSHAKEATEIDLFSDTSHNFNLGCGGYYKNQWFFIGWDEFTNKSVNPSIEYLELFAVTVAVKLWIHHLKNSRIVLFCDNE